MCSHWDGAASRRCPESRRVPQKYRGTYQNRPNTVKIKGPTLVASTLLSSNRARFYPPRPIAQGERGTQKCFICWAQPGLLSSRMNHDRRHGSYGRAQRAEDIGHNLAETGHFHDEDFVENLRAVPSEAWAQAFCLIRATSLRPASAPWARRPPPPAFSPATLRWNPLPNRL